MSLLDRNKQQSCQMTYTERRQNMLRNVKKEVKQVMEEAVTKKFVHEESSSITSLCCAVEVCLLDGLKKRALGLFKESTTAALFKKCAKHCVSASNISKIIVEMETNNESLNSSKKSQESVNSQQKKPYHQKYLWLRQAIFGKQLAKILEYLVENSSRYYENDALISDPVDGPIFASLLVGPCALEYTKMKTTDHYWTDPPADELVQRHRIHSGGSHALPGSQGSPKRLGLQFNRSVGNGSNEEHTGFYLSAREFVESLHQNNKTTLLYGKNNVFVQPKEDIEALAGYLSLNQYSDSVMIMWTPNQLMNGCTENMEDTDKSTLWRYAMTVFLDEVVYIHCHQQADIGGTIVLVGQDGVQRPPIHFPKGGHLLSFLSVLETAIKPDFQLDPPLWNQRGKGKVFPKLKQKSSLLSNASSSSSTSSYNSADEEETSDYVFRIIASFKPESITPEMLDPKAKIIQEKSAHSVKLNLGLGMRNGSSHMRNVHRQNSNGSVAKDSNLRLHIKQVCDTMKTQIISRAFYGWLAHCRHLKTVRTHLSGLVNQTIIMSDMTDEQTVLLTKQKWQDLHQDGVVKNGFEVFYSVYYGGIEHEIRHEVWPYLLGHYQFGWTEEDRKTVDDKGRMEYDKTMSEWLAVEAIVQQRDRESKIAKIAKLSQESTDGQIPLARQDSTLSNPVFESFDSEEFTHIENIENENKSEMSDSKETRQPELIIQSGQQLIKKMIDKPPDSPDDGLGDSIARGSSTTSRSKLDSLESTDYSKPEKEEITDKSILQINEDNEMESVKTNGHFQIPNLASCQSEDVFESFEKSNILSEDENQQPFSASKESLISPASPTSHGCTYTTDLLDNVSLNIHRIDKDVLRCDRNHPYFTQCNLDKLRNVICTYVWKHLEIGYIQGMCDLVAPLLVIFDDEALTYSCFCELMKRMSNNFPHGGAMDTHFANMRSLIQILDSELFEHMHHYGDYTHFYFCYRWFLLDFKRELLYEDVFSVWETIWAAKHISSANFVLFVALALVEYYRDIILDNNMDFTDIIKFFNEMAERHNAKKVLNISRELVLRVQKLIDNN